MIQGVLYAVLFLICVAVFARVRKSHVRQFVLLVVSYALYLTWTRWFVTILLASTFINFLTGKWLQRRQTATALWTGILLNFALLSTFKYLPEIAPTISFTSLQAFSHLALPLGISFWTFQAMSYLFDLYRGEELDPSFLEFALYMVFFPITISGPICRMPDMLPQFRSEQTTPWSDIGLGFRRIATGVLMMQFAKLLGQGILAGDGINSGFDRLTHWSGTDVWCLAFGYGLQLFFDFAGYSHIAIGAARALGLALPENFSRPFASPSLSVFWTRWHMSLSFWIRDYLFLPLAVARREIWWRNLTLVISMVLFGLWHKATLLFLIWGFYHGVLLVLHRQAQQVERKFGWEFWTPASWLVTISLVSLGWIFFRANSAGQAQSMLLAVLSPATYRAHFLSGSLYLLLAGLALSYGVVLFVNDLLERYSVDGPDVAARPTAPRSAALAVLARWRWFWLTPLFAVVLLAVLIVTFTRGASTAQMMYGNF